MAFTMERWHSAVGQRFSVRKYQGDPSSEELEQLFEKAKQLSVRGVRIVVAQAPRVFAGGLLRGNRVKGTTWIAAFLSKNGMSQDVGYLGEAFVLECAAMGVGTCWMGIYNKKAVLEVVKLNEGETLTCITPLGVSAEKYAARPRKTLDKLTGLTQAQLQDLPQWQQYALSCARMAPSATNTQPWRYVVEGEHIRVCCTGSNYGYGKLDCGITMLHLELGAAHDGVVGEWVQEGDDAIFKPTSYER
ncbi:nitroreductase family protein [Christensenellaceae bacterium OttesenSCG-928-L17]|nr:nitroreductase family protein [Christensenellaceae bacterium OttesenSCG-928-L17]